MVIYEVYIHVYNTSHILSKSEKLTISDCVSQISNITYAQFVYILHIGVIHLNLWWIYYIAAEDAKLIDSTGGTSTGTSKGY